MSVDSLLDNARFLMAVVRRHRLARLIITRYLTAGGASAPTKAAADANVELLCRLTKHENERISRLTIGAVALLCEVDDLHVHTGLTDRVVKHCPLESVRLAQRYLKIDSIVATGGTAPLRGPPPRKTF